MAIDCAYTIEGQGPALFLIHGIGARRATFAELVEGLKDRFTCIRYDLRGHGESPTPDTPFGLHDLVDDLEALRSALSVECAHFAGHSLGGMIGPAYARRYPERVRSLGLWSTAAFRTPDDSAKVNAVVSAMREKGIPQVLDTLSARWFTDEFTAQRPDLIEKRKQQVIDTPAEVFLNVFDIYAQTEMAPWLHEISVPCQLVTGAQDGGCNPRLNREMADALPNAELIILDHLKHAIFIEATERVLPVVREFLIRQDD